MIASIKLNGMYNVGINNNGDIKIGETELNIKDIPFVRYNFGGYGEEEVEFISRDKDRYKNSTALVELVLNEYTQSELAALEEELDNVAKFVYIEVDDETVANGRLSDEVIELLELTTDFTVDSYCILDKSTTLDMITFKKLVREVIEATDIEEERVAVCGSPLSFSEYACLTAVKAREIMSDYSLTDDVPLPSANHQKGCCGCIQYINVDMDCPAPLGKVKRTTSERKENSGETKKAKKPVKQKSSLTIGKFKF